MFQLGYLADHPEFIPVIAEWYFQEWGRYRAGDSVERRVERLTQAAGHRRVPTVIVAHEAGKVLGSAMLIACDMQTRPELTPWVAGVYVAAEERGKGIGVALVERVMAEARALGYARIYLFTFDAEKYYERMGWRVKERTEYLGGEVAVMEFELGGVVDIPDEEVLRRDEEMEMGEVKPMTHEEFVRKLEEARTTHSKRRP